jgi:superfamily II DNA or RNA helicase
MIQAGFNFERSPDSGLMVPDSGPVTIASDGQALRKYQAEAVAGVLKQLEEFRSTIAVLPTGSGKTRIAAELIRHWPGRAMMIAHRDELLVQARTRLASETGEMVGLEQAQFFAGDERVVVGSVQTLCMPARLERWQPDDFGLIIVDEAHHSPSKSYRRIIDHFSGAKIVGITATPDRADEKAMGQVFESVAYVYEIEDAINDGWLCPIRVRQVFIGEINLSACRTTAGDLNQGDLNAAMAVEEALHGVVKATIEQAGDSKTLVFTTSVENAKRLAEIFNRYKPDSARSVDGGTQIDDRRGILAAYKRGEFQYLTNCAIATEGFDEPEIACVAMARPTKSRSLFAQMVGRGLRIHPSKPNGCIAEGQRVLTDIGLVPIEDVTTAMKVWDGVDFVCHGGAILRGEKEVVTYAGLTATPDHEVWTQEGWKAIGECSEQQVFISITGHGRIPVREASGHFRRGVESWERESSLPDGEMHGMRDREANGPLQLSQRDCGMSGVRSTQEGPAMVADEMRGGEAEVLQREGRPLSELRGEGNPLRIRHSDRDGAVDREEFGNEPRTSDRQDRQRQGVRAGEFEAFNEPAEHGPHEDEPSRTKSACLSSEASGSELFRRDAAATLGAHDRGRDTGSLEGKLEEKVQTRVWDILNAGPLRRFTVEGLLVHNCLILEFTGNSGKHHLASSVDILGGRYEEDEVDAAQEIVKKNPGMRADDALAQAHTEAVEKAKRLEAAKRAQLQAQVQYTTRDFNPFDVFHMKRTQEDEWGERFGGKIASEKQIAALQKFKIDVPKDCTSQQASRLLGTCIVRMKKGLASYGQIKILTKFGIPAINVSFKHASEMIEAVKANGWKRPSDAVIGNITGRAREAGEEG